MNAGSEGESAFGFHSKSRIMSSVNEVLPRIGRCGRPGKSETD